MTDIGIDDDFVRRIGEHLQPGTATVFVLAGRPPIGWRRSSSAFTRSCCTPTSP
jgi:Protein of unknown function (DUF1269)